MVPICVPTSTFKSFSPSGFYQRHEISLLVSRTLTEINVLFYTISCKIAPFVLYLYSCTGLVLHLHTTVSCYTRDSFGLFQNNLFEKNSNDKEKSRTTGTISLGITVI